MISIQNYVRPQSLEEAWTLNQSRRNRIIGGMLWLKMGSGRVNTAIDLCDLGLDTIEESDEQFSIGAMVSLRQLENCESLNRYSQNAIKNAVKDIVGVQFRNMATVGGSIFSRFGFSDVLTVFMAMDCYVELYKGGLIPLERFAVMKRDRDILLRLIVKKTSGRFAYLSMRNQRTDFPVLALALSCVNGQYRCAIGARPSRAILIGDERHILDGGIQPESAKAFAQYAAEVVPTGSNLRGSAAYRSRLIKVLTERGLLMLGGEE